MKIGVEEGEENGPVIESIESIGKGVGGCGVRFAMQLSCIMQGIKYDARNASLWHIT